LLAIESSGELSA